MLPSLRRLDRGFLRADGRERIVDIREAIKKAMGDGCGIYRPRTSMETTCRTLRDLRERFARIGLADRDAVFNTELIAALELDCMLDVAETVAHSALAREESRGSHTREDFPKRDDARFLKHSLAFRKPDGSPRIDYLPVTITRWQPKSASTEPLGLYKASCVEASHHRAGGTGMTGSRLLVGVALLLGLLAAPGGLVGHGLPAPRPSGGPGGPRG